jgi:UDP-glucose 4-epimerase
MLKKTHFISGGAGFIAQTLIRLLLGRGDHVIAADNLSRGKRAFLAEFEANSGFRFQVVDCADPQALSKIVFDPAAPVTDIWHLAANSDIPAGIADPAIDLKDTFLTTFHLLKMARDRQIGAFHFASSSAIYGDLGDVAVSEDIGPLEPISNYGAMKLASEAQIRAAVEAYLGRADIFRFPNVIGVPATHGVIVDFVQKLRATPNELRVLGDGTQRKPYLHVEDLVDAMIFITDHAVGRYNVYNIGPRDVGVSVQFIAETVRDRVSPGAGISYGTSNRGWVGDVPRFNYSTDRLTELGWTPRLGSKDAVIRAVEQIAHQEAAD